MLAVSQGVTAAPDVSVGHLLLQMVVALVVVVGGIWVLSKLLARTRVGRGEARIVGGLRVGGTRAGPRGSARRGGDVRGSAPAEHSLAVISRRPVGKGKSIAVVGVGAQRFLVGIADAGFTPLGELGPGGPEDLDDRIPLPDPAPAGPGAGVAPSAGAPGAQGARSWIEALREATARR
jgi:flagellar biogenesis protein FliO